MGFPDAELSLTFTDDAGIAALAGRYGRAPEPTDVLAFSMLEGEGSAHRGAALGDVVISIETAERQAEQRGEDLDTELRDLLIHGVLHLVGMDHQRAPDAANMRRMEEQLRWTLARLG